MASRRSCVNHGDSFCYICGKFTPKSQRLNIKSKVTIACKHYFGCQVGDQDKSWAPHMCCRNCYASLTQWLNGKRKSMSFAVPMVWHKPTNHFSDCYFCFTKVSGRSKRQNARNVKFHQLPEICSALKENSDYGLLCLITVTIARHEVIGISER